MDNIVRTSSCFFYLKSVYTILFISYDKEITPIENDDGFKWYEGYDYCLSGVVILDFVDAAEKYSGVDVSGIREELVKKRAWYYETYKSGDE